MVFAYNESTGEVVEETVTAVHVHTDPVIIHLVIDGELIETTPEHPFFTRDEGWVAAGELDTGDAVMTAALDFGFVESVTALDEPQTMYNLTVDDAHTFFVGTGDWLVHNECNWINGQPQNDVAGIYEFQDQILLTHGLNRIYVGSSRMIRTRFQQHIGNRLINFDGFLRYLEIPQPKNLWRGLQDTNLRIVEQIRILQYGGVENLANSYRYNTETQTMERYYSNPMAYRDPRNRARIIDFVNNNPLELPAEILRLPDDF
jgi:hypothetical protein